VTWQPHNVTEATTTEEWGHWERILEEIRSNNNNRTSDREVVLNIMRDVEATLNANPTWAITTIERPLSEAHVAVEHLVSSVTVSRSELQNITENVGLRDFDERGQGDNISQTVIRANEERDEDYILTFALAENVIVIRDRDDFLPQSDLIVKTHIIVDYKMTYF